MKSRYCLVLAGALCFSPVPALNATSAFYTIPATANIFSAGLSSPVDPGGGGAGTLPFVLPISAADKYFLLSASGQVSQLYQGYYHGPDGYAWGMNITPYQGISGFLADVTLPLAAVFLGDGVALPPPPPTLDFRASGIGLNFASLSPQIGQVFFVGDGVDSARFSQRFNVPAGATRLFLGFPDALTGTGSPGSYGENYGSLNVSITTVPEPGAAALLILGACLLRPCRRR